MFSILKKLSMLLLIGFAFQDVSSVCASSRDVRAVRSSSSGRTSVPSPRGFRPPEGGDGAHGYSVPEPIERRSVPVRGEEILVPNFVNGSFIEDWLNPNQRLEGRPNGRSWFFDELYGGWELSDEAIKKILFLLSDPFLDIEEFIQDAKIQNPMDVLFLLSARYIMESGLIDKIDAGGGLELHDYRGGLYNYVGLSQIVLSCIDLVKQAYGEDFLKNIPDEKIRDMTSRFSDLMSTGIGLDDTLKELHYLKDVGGITTEDDLFLKILENINASYPPQIDYLKSIVVSGGGIFDEHGNFVSLGEALFPYVKSDLIDFWKDSINRDRTPDRYDRLIYPIIEKISILLHDPELKEAIKNHPNSGYIWGITHECGSGMYFDPEIGTPLDQGYGMDFDTGYRLFESWGDGSCGIYSSQIRDRSALREKFSSVFPGVKHPALAIRSNESNFTIFGKPFISGAYWIGEVRDGEFAGLFEFIPSLNRRPLECFSKPEANKFHRIDASAYKLREPLKSRLKDLEYGDVLNEANPITIYPTDIRTGGHFKFLIKPDDVFGLAKAMRHHLLAGICFATGLNGNFMSLGIRRQSLGTGWLTFKNNSYRFADPEDGMGSGHSDYFKFSNEEAEIVADHIKYSSYDFGKNLIRILVSLDSYTDEVNRKLRELGVS